MKILTVKFKGKLSLSKPRGPKGGVDLQTHFFLILALDECVVNFMPWPLNSQETFAPLEQETE